MHVNICKSGRDRKSAISVYSVGSVSFFIHISFVAKQWKIFHLSMHRIVGEVDQIGDSSFAAFLTLKTI